MTLLNLLIIDKVATLLRKYTYHNDHYVHTQKRRIIEDDILNAYIS